MINEKAANLIDKLQLLPHPEGGYFVETYRSAESIPKSGLPLRFQDERAFSTAIYFLLTGEQFSSFHCLKSDEIWHFYEGSSITIFSINEEGELNIFSLGRNLSEGELYQIVIKAGTWFAAELKDKSSFALAGCTVAPGFDFSDFELAVREKLTKLFPRHREIIKKLTKEE